MQQVLLQRNPTRPTEAEQLRLSPKLRGKWLIQLLQHTPGIGPLHRNAVVRLELPERTTTQVKP